MIPLHVPIQFKGPDDPNPFMGIVNELAFHIWNMAKSDGAGVHRLTRETPFGKVDVMRVGDILYVSTKGGGQRFLIEILSAVDSYYGEYSVNTGSIKKIIDLQPYSNPYELFDRYFQIDTVNLDRYEESCVCVVNGVSNVAADNTYVLAENHWDDWHFKKFMWVGFPAWWAGEWQPNKEADTWGHPGLTARAAGQKFHWSHSPYTFSSSRSHISRGIDQEKRIYRPGMVHLSPDGGTTPYLMDELLRKPYGKMPWTRDADKKLTRYNEKVEATGSGTFTMNQPDDNWVTYLWPFVPYLWEIPYFFVFSWSGNDALYGNCYIPESGFGSRSWDYVYNDENGVEHTETIHSDNFTFTGSAVVKESTNAPRPHYVVIGNSYELVDGPISNTWTDTASESCSWSCSIEKTVPIGPVCEGDDLFVTNTVAISGGYTYESETIHTKDTTFGDGIYLFPPSYPEMWGLGESSDSSQTTTNSSHETSITGTVESVLKAGSIVIDSGSGTLSFSGIRTTVGNYDGLFKWIVDSVGGPSGSEGHSESSGTANSNSQTAITCDRNIVCFEVLDYESESNFMYDSNYVKAFALVYKKITIESSIPRTISITADYDCGSAQASIISDGGGFNTPAPRAPTEEEIVETDHTTATGSREVEYILYVNVDGNVYIKTLATFTGGLGAGSGQRCYGVNVKMDGERGLVLVSYDLDNFVTTANAQSADNYYDSPLNFEDWNVNLNINLWETHKRVIGIVALTDPDDFGTELFDEQDPLPEEVYSISSRTEK
jgi:hypothetical protein